MLRQLREKLRRLLGTGAQREPLSDEGASRPAPGLFENGTAQRAVEPTPDDVKSLLAQAATHVVSGHTEDAADCFELALALVPDHLPALLGLARLRRETGDCAAALCLLERAAQAAPRGAEPYFELGLTHNRNGDTRAALLSYERALVLAPDHVAAGVNAGLIHLAQLGDARSAQRYFERAAALQPDSVAAQANLGLALQEQGQFDAALAHYNRLIEAHPGIAEYRWNRGIALLSRGDFANGWSDYELRNVRTGRSVARRFPFAEWDGAALSGRHILIYGEQGIGDEIMFASCVPDVLRQARGVVIECDVRLAPLFQRSFPAARVHGAPRDNKRDWLQAFPALNVQTAAGSLPRFLRRDWSDFPRHEGYLAADAARRAHWQTRLAALGGGLKVGICWRGGTPKTRRETRSLAIEQCLPLFAASGCHFISLQGGDCGDEVAVAERHGARLHWWPQVMRDIDELAALIMALDLVIAVPSTMVHLAGAQGRPLLVMLSASPEWRYLWQGERMPWYPSAHLFRQSAPGHWDSVMRQVQRYLTGAALRGTPPP